MVCTPTSFSLASFPFFSPSFSHFVFPFPRPLPQEWSGARRAFSPKSRRGLAPESRVAIYLKRRRCLYLGIPFPKCSHCLLYGRSGNRFTFWALGFRGAPLCLRLPRYARKLFSALCPCFSFVGVRKNG